MPAFSAFFAKLGAFVAVLLCSNLIGPAKIVQLDLPSLGKTDFGAGILLIIGAVANERFSVANPSDQ